MTASEQVVRVSPDSYVKLHPDAWTEPFWKAARERRLVCKRCTQCGTFQMPPAPFCHECQSQEHHWVQLSGKGWVYSYTVARQALVPALKDSIPYVVAVIDLPDAPGARLVANLVDCDPDQVSITMPVKVVWAEVQPGIVIPRFRPAAD
jgi:uncharacterized OB-fold protein